MSWYHGSVSVIIIIILLLFIYQRSCKLEKLAN